MNYGANSYPFDGCIVNGIPSGLWYYVSDRISMLEMIRKIAEKGFGDSIVCVYSIPAVSMIGISDMTIEELDDPYQIWGLWITSQFSTDGREITLNSTPPTLDGYTPRNQKLRTYPYCYLGFEPSNRFSKYF